MGEPNNLRVFSRWVGEIPCVVLYGLTYSLGLVPSRTPSIPIELYDAQWMQPNDFDYHDREADLGDRFRLTYRLQQDGAEKTTIIVTYKSRISYHLPVRFIRTYEMQDHEIESAQNQYLLDNGYSRSAHNAQEDAFNVTQLAYLFSLTSSQVDSSEMANIITKYAQICYHTHQVYEAAHTIKQMSPRPELESQALAIFAEHAPLPSDFAAEVAALDALTSASQMRRHWNSAYGIGDTRIKSNVAKLSSVTVHYGQGRDLSVDLETLAVELPEVTQSFSVVANAQEDGTVAGGGAFVFQQDATEALNIELTITAEDGVTTSTETLTVTRASTEEGE